MSSCRIRIFLLISAALALICPQHARSQYTTTDWAIRTDATINSGYAEMEVDAMENLYALQFSQGFTDLDPGPGSYTVNSGSAIYLVKFNNQQQIQWAKAFELSGNNTIRNLEVSPSGDIFLSGFFQDSIDLDPGPSEHKLKTPYVNGFIVSLDGNGNFKWAAQFESSSSDVNALTLDANGNINAGIGVSGTVDVDPSSGTVHYTSQPNGSDLIVAKFDPLGQLLMSEQISSSKFIFATHLEVDEHSNRIITGEFEGKTDFDPGSGTHFYTPLVTSGFVLKLDSSGIYQWFRPFINLKNVIAATDSSGNVYCAGNFTGSVDFDPGPATSSLSTSQRDYFLMKLTPGGNLIWLRSSGSVSCDVIVFDLAVTRNGDSYLTGNYYGTMDLDHGAYTQHTAPTAINGGYILRTKNDGQFIWGGSIDFSSFGTLRHIRVLPPHSVYFEGAVFGIPFINSFVDVDPGSDTIYVTVDSTIVSGFIVKLSLCDLFSDVSAVRATCHGESLQLQVKSGGQVTWYSDLTSTVALASGPGYTTAPLTIGYHSLAIEHSACGNERFPILIVTNPNPKVSVTGNNYTMCEGEPATYQFHGAISYSLNGIATPSIHTMIPQSAVLYTLTGLSPLGCSGSTLFVHPLDPCLGMTQHSLITNDLFPNPAIDRFTISNTGPGAVVRILDPQGQTVKVARISGRHETIRVDDFSKGVYMVEMNVNGVPVRKKLIIQ